MSVCAAALTTCLPALDPTILKLITFGRSTLDTRQYLSDYIASRENISFRFEQRKKSQYYLFPFFNPRCHLSRCSRPAVLLRTVKSFHCAHLILRMLKIHKCTKYKVENTKIHTHPHPPYAQNTQMHKI